MSAGDWWTESWTPVVGCDMGLSCAPHCWARRWARRLAHMPQASEKYAGLINESGEWTGVVRLDEKELLRPEHWRKPRIVAVSLMGDVFLASDDVINRLYAVMALCPQHRFVVLTKRSRQRRDYLDGSANASSLTAILNRRLSRRQVIAEYILAHHHEAVSANAIDMPDGPQYAADLRVWPLPNVIEMVSVSTQTELDERWPWLAKTPAAKRGLHIEPMLEPMDLRGQRFFPHPLIDWVVVGAETGPGARPMHPDWVRKIRDDCAVANVGFWFKGWGDWLPEVGGGANIDNPRYRFDDTGQGYLPFSRQKRHRLLDGREHNEVPW